MNGNELYAFVLKGDVAQAAIDRAAAKTLRRDADIVERIVSALPMDLLADEHLAEARKMAPVYVAIGAFENAARKFIQDRLLEDHGANWWTTRVSTQIQKEAEKRKADEEVHRYHGTRGEALIFYTQLGDLAKIVQANEDSFQDYIPSPEWARQIFRSLERSRNVIMHSGQLSMNDIERVAMNIRDWLLQVGG